MWTAFLGLAMAGEIDPQVLESKLAEIAPLRSLRVTTDAPSVPQALWADVASGKVRTQLTSVEGHAAKKALGVAILDAPIGRLWAAVNDEESKVQWTKLGYLELVSGENCKDGRVVLQYLPVTLVSDRWGAN